MQSLCSDKEVTGHGGESGHSRPGPLGPGPGEPVPHGGFRSLVRTRFCSPERVLLGSDYYLWKVLPPPLFSLATSVVLFGESTFGGTVQSSPPSTCWCRFKVGAPTAVGIEGWSHRVQGRSVLVLRLLPKGNSVCSVCFQSGRVCVSTPKRFVKPNALLSLVLCSAQSSLSWMAAPLQPSGPLE